jgi:hypothetical protein
MRIPHDEDLLGLFRYFHITSGKSMISGERPNSKPEHTGNPANLLENALILRQATDFWDVFNLKFRVSNRQ